MCVKNLKGIIKGIFDEGKSEGDKLGAIKKPFIAPELAFFTDKILKITLNEDAYRYKDPGGAFVYIPPLRKRILAFFSPKYIEDHLEIKEDKDTGNIVVTLDIVKNGELHKVKKEYQDRDIIKNPNKDQSIMALWPSFKRDGWNL